MAKDKSKKPADKKKKKADSIKSDKVLKKSAKKAEKGFIKELKKPKKKPETPNGQWSVDFRPEQLGSMLLSPAVKLSIKSLLKNPPHTILLTGPSGSGKTSVAQIIAAKLTGGSASDAKPYNCATESGINDVRKLLEQCSYLPGKAGTRRVVILDEVQALTEAASKTLLEPLEANKSHITFILCTDQPGKVRPTVRSRAMKIDFEPPSAEDLAKHLRDLADYAGDTPKGWEPKELDRLFLACAHAGNNNIREAVQITQLCLSNIDISDCKGIAGAVKLGIMPSATLTDMDGDNVALLIKLLTMRPEKRKHADMLKVVAGFTSVGDSMAAISFLIEGAVRWFASPDRMTAPETDRLDGMAALLEGALAAKDAHMTTPASGFNEARARLTSLLMTTLLKH